MDNPKLGLCFRILSSNQAPSWFVSLTVLNLILNDLMVPLNGSLVVADRIRQKLMDQTEDLKDIQEALIDAQLDVIKANGVNKLNKEQLRNILVIKY